MAKIPQSFIDDVLERSDIVDIVNKRVRLKKTGANYSALCPFHQEKSPSFTVNPDKQFYYCFGCGSGGNAISFIMDFDRASFVDAIEILAQQLGLSVPQVENPQLEKIQKQKRSIYDILGSISDYYQQQLRYHPQKKKAADYLKQRGLSPDICQQFAIGYAPPGWDNLLKQFSDSSDGLQLLNDAGMIVQRDDASGFYDRFRDRLMFPIVDNRGRVIGFGGRVFNDDKPKYLNSPETTVFHKQQELYGLWQARQANRHLSRLIMVEGYMDVVALAQFGISNAVATLGTAAGTSHLEKAFRHTSEVVFCFDGDAAGRKAAERALEAALPLMEAGRQLRFCFLPEGEDPDSWVRSIGKERFNWHLDQSANLSEHLFNHCSEGLQLQKPDDKAVLVNRIMPQIQRLPETPFKTLILQFVAEKIGLSLDSISQFIETTPPATASTEATVSNDEKQPVQRQKLSTAERKVLRSSARVASALLLVFPEFAALTPDLQKVDLVDEKDCELLKQLHAFILDTPNCSASYMLGHWLHRENAQIKHLLQIALPSDDKEKLEQEYLDAIVSIQTQQQQRHNSQQIVQFKDKKPLELSQAEREAYARLFKK